MERCEAARVWGQCALGMALCALVPGVAAAQSNQPPAGTLKPRFGTGGFTTTDIGGSKFPDAESVAVQDNGKIIVAGSSDLDDPAGGFALVRYLHDGSVDPAFGVGGQVVTLFSGRANGTGVAVEPNGRIVVAGTLMLADGSLNVALARYRHDGQLDSSFGTNGTVALDIGAGFSTANALAIDVNGKIVIVGEASPSSGARAVCAVARFNSDGSLDTAFGDGGRTLTDFANTSNQSFGAVAIQGDGKIVAAGTRRAIPIHLTGTIARYNADGSIDTTFGVNGQVLSDFGPQTAISSVTIQSDGKIVAAGSVDVDDQGTLGIAVTRFNGDGTADVDFGGAGQVTTGISGSTAFARGVGVDGCGRIVVAGTSEGLDGPAVGFPSLFRYQANGLLDPTFGSGGVSATPLGDGSAFGNAFAFERNGDLLLAGSFQLLTSDVPEFFVARYEGGGQTACP